MTHIDYRFSVTVHTDDLPMLYCIRGLSHFAQKKGLINITWSGTGKEEWESSGHVVTFRFTRPAFRSDFLREAHRLLPSGWREVKQSDNDPAKPK